ncbi:MAG: DUF4365 domain-containing protein [Terracidiphilus sp.]
MFRPDQHDTDKKGQALLRSSFADAGWEVTQIGEDYGRDFEIEVFRDKKTTGVLFNVQLKSTESPSYSAGGDFLSVELDMPNARYLALELETPAILIQAEVTQKRLFWSAPQIDLALLNTLENRPHGQTCTVRVPTLNELSATKDKLLDTVTSLLTLLAARKLSQTDTRDFVAATTSMAESTRLKQELRDKADALEMMDAQANTESGEFDAARRAIQSVISSPLSSVESKFFALLIEEKNERLALRGEERYGSEHLDVVLSTANKLRKLTHNGPGALKYYALVTQVAADFYSLTREDWGLYQNWKVHEKTGDLWWRAKLRVIRAETSDRIERKLKQFLRLVRLSERTPFQSALPVAFLRIVEGGATLINRLEFEGMADTADSIRDLIFRVCKLAAAIAANFSMDRERALAAMSSAMLSRNRQAECVSWAEAEVEKIADEEIRNSARMAIADQPVTLGGEALIDDPIPMPMEQQIYENMASGLGIDLSNTEDLVSQMVKVGIDDLDPTRVLRDCRHLFWTFSRQGHNFFHLMLAQQLQLPTMGGKVLHCTLHGYTRVGLSLDETYQRFRDDYCDKCPDRSPRSADWHYTHEWQQGENDRNREFLDGPRSATYDRKPVGPPPPIAMPGKTCAACGLEFNDSAAPWWCGWCQTWFCQRPECLNVHENHPMPF